MELFGMSLTSVYLFILIFSGLLMAQYLFFGGFLEVLARLPAFLNPVLILSFFTFSSASLYILELWSTLTVLHQLFISSIIALLLTFVLNVFIFWPIKRKLRDKN